MSTISAPPPPPNLNTSLALHCTLTDFLTVAIHTILYTRSLYPRETFLTTRAYNLPVHQNRHPQVCAWINSSISALTPLLQNNAIKRVVVVIYSQAVEPLERFLFDISRFPVVPANERFTEFSERPERPPPNIVDIEEQLRATISRLDYTGSKLTPLPENCTFTLAVELRDEAEPPIGHPMPWIPAEPRLQTGEKGKSNEVGKDIGGVRTSPVRLVDAGEFVLETWVEEGVGKFDTLEVD